MSYQVAKNLGIKYLTAYAILASAKDVLVGNKTQTLDVYYLVCATFLFSTLFFLALNKVRHTGKATFSLPAEKRKETISGFLNLNITTAICWIGLYVSLKYIEPVIVSAIFGGINPIATMLINRKLRPGSGLHWSDWVCSYGILLSCVFLCWTSFSGLSAVKDVSSLEMTIGFTALIVSSISGSATTVYSKCLSDLNLRSSFIMCHRFYILIAAAFIMGGASLSFISFIVDNIWLLLFLSLFGVILSLYFLQEGIKHCEPLLVEMLLVFLPIFTLLIQAFDDRLDTSYTTIIGTASMISFALINIFYQTKGNLKNGNQ
ncbi:hypothetical protein PRUB_a0815 [Pseudoalteromonas rubra]|uniref:EamA domain-containing protein n=1 Tax=Pseudoalteromonas rubra TaxID=43658 RepID=A0A8T0C6A2_9GAMM|nr:biotin carboxylase [Pseudoalteromonas rubra]KAF7786297.1 hypothetical protein PRUB_a0815 [Pseudoalteromonas rubra]